MIKESFSKEDECPNPDLDVKNMVLLAIATSIDALAVGVTFAFLNVDILPAVSLSEASPSFCPWPAKGGQRIWMPL